MTPEQQRIACAELDGWLHRDSSSEFQEWEGWARWRSPIGVWHTQCPDYLSDLNAVHALEEKLEHDHKKEYASGLFQLVIKDREGLTEYDSWYLHIHATATQRVEAILRATGRWEE